VKSDVAGPLCERFAPMVARLLRRTFGPQAPIACTVDVVLLCVLERARRLQPRSDLQRFIARATARVVRAELQRRARASSLPPRRSRAARPRAACGMKVREHDAAVRLYRILDRLNAADRIAFVFHFVEGVEIRDVAAALGWTVLATRRGLERVLRAVDDGIRRDPVLRRLREAPRLV
jgi:RNA polymerase sigma-70 factor (ECF subfamily)